MTEMPSWALRAATLRPPICERRPSEIARPAASSAARLMRRPLDSFSNDFERSFCVLDRFRYALSAETLVLICIPMMFSSVIGLLLRLPVHGLTLVSYRRGAVIR